MKPVLRLVDTGRGSAVDAWSDPGSWSLTATPPILAAPGDIRGRKLYADLGRLVFSNVPSSWAFAAVAADLLRRIAVGTAGHPDENGFTYGLLYARELDRAEHSRRLAHHWAPKAATV